MRVVKGISIIFRECPYIFPIKSEIVSFFLVNSDFVNTRES